MAVRPIMIIDAVVRKQRYERDHDVSIKHLTSPAWPWQATWQSADGCSRLIADHELGRLIDTLEALSDGAARRQP